MDPMCVENPCAITTVLLSTAVTSFFLSYLVGHGPTVPFRTTYSVYTFASCDYTRRVKEVGCSLPLFACHVETNRYHQRYEGQPLATPQATCGR